MLLLIKGRHGGGVDGTCSVYLAELLKIGKEERPAFAERATDAATELVLSQFRFMGQHTAPCKIIAGIRDIITEKFVQGAMKVVGSCLGQNRNGGSGSTSDFRGISVRVH